MNIQLIILFVIIDIIAVILIIKEHIDRAKLTNLSMADLEEKPYGLISSVGIKHILQIRDNNQLSNPLYPPEKRMDKSAAGYNLNDIPEGIFINNLDSNSLGGGHDLNSLYNSVRNDGNYVLSINERSRGEPDMYQQVGILYQQDGKTYQLMGRRTYPGSYEWEYYVRGKDSGGMDVKYPLNRKQEIYNDEEITIDLNANPFKVKIFENENYKYIPIL